MKNFKIHCLAVFCIFVLSVQAYDAKADSDTFNALFSELTFDDEPEAPARRSRPSYDSSYDEYPKEVTRDLFLDQDMVDRYSVAINKMRRIVSRGGWPVISKKGKRLRVNDTSREIVAIKRQLVIRGDLRRSDVGRETDFDNRLKAAILRFQKRHGLFQNGYVDPRTREMLNVTANWRLRQLQTNVVRLRSAIERNNNASRYVVVNVPDFSMQAVSRGQVDIASRVIVGRHGRETPTLSVEIKGVNFNPFWHVPQSIVEKDLIPQQLKTNDYMQVQKIRAYKSWGGEEVPVQNIDWRSPIATQLKYRQDPGPQNALGSIRIHMPNPDIIYLHDTPMKRLFGQSFRAYSAGCIRVQRIEDLARWILQDHETWSNRRITETLQSRKRTDAMISKPIPVHLIYLTSWVSEEGDLHYRYDIYNRDGDGADLPGGQQIAQQQGLRALAP